MGVIPKKRSYLRSLKEILTLSLLFEHDIELNALKNCGKVWMSIICFPVCLFSCLLKYNSFKRLSGFFCLLKEVFKCGKTQVKIGFPPKNCGNDRRGGCKDSGIENSVKIADKISPLFPLMQDSVEMTAVFVCGRNDNYLNYKFGKETELGKEGGRILNEFHLILLKSQSYCSGFPEF